MKRGDSRCPFKIAFSKVDPRNYNLIKSKLIVRSIVELRRARGFVSGNLLGRLKRSVVFKADRNSSGPE